MPLPLVIYVHLPPKYLVSSVPAAAIIVARLAIDKPRRTLPLVAAVLGTYFVVCIQLLRADAAFSNLGRRAAAELVRPLLHSGERVWFTGHWGFQWYAMKEGATPLTLRDSPSPRDYVVGPSGNYDGGPVIDNFQNRYLVRKLENTGKLAVLWSIDKVKLRGAVVPGDQLRIEVELQRARLAMLKMGGKIFVGDELACEADIMFGYGDA